MKTSLAKNLAAVVAFFLILSLFSGFNSSFDQVQEISITDLVSKLKNREVEKIIVEGSVINITLRNKKELISRKEPEAGFSEMFKNYGVTAEELQAASVEIKDPSGLSFWFKVLLPILLPFALIVILFLFISKQAQKGAMQAFSFGKSSARIAGKNEKITFDDIAGLYEAKEELKEIVGFLMSPKKYLEIGAQIPRGVLLIGRPGTGKTLIARAVAGEANVPFYHISASEFVEMFVGVGASRVRDLFQTAKKNSPSILFIDEIDAIGRHRGSGVGGGHDEREQTLNQILVEMDGFERNTGVIVIAATNRPDVLDSALLRPGRFDRRITLDEPDIKCREEVLKLHLKNKKANSNINVRKIAERTPGFSGADLANLVNEGSLLAARRDKLEVGQEELLESIEKVLLGPERKSHILSVKEKEIVSYHEAGHALVAAFCSNTDPVHKISIISRGSAGGYTLKLPSEDRRLHNYNYFLDELAVLLGGYSAEKTVFNEVTTGASDDLMKASDLARRLVTDYGMSRLGPVTFDGGPTGNGQRNFSENSAELIDKEVKFLVDEAHKQAKAIITKKRAKLNLIAKRLIEKEVIEKEEFEKIIKSK